MASEENGGRNDALDKLTAGPTTTKAQRRQTAYYPLVNASNKPIVNKFAEPRYGLFNRNFSALPSNLEEINLLDTFENLDAALDGLTVLFFSLVCCMCCGVYTAFDT